MFTLFYLKKVFNTLIFQNDTYKEIKEDNTHYNNTPDTEHKIMFSIFFGIKFKSIFNK